MVLIDGAVDGCEPRDVRSSIETATDKERCQQRYSWKPDNEKKAEVRPVAAHYR